MNLRKLKGTIMMGICGVPRSLPQECSCSFS